jgi:hypothetical protein
MDGTLLLASFTDCRHCSEEMQTLKLGKHSRLLHPLYLDDDLLQTITTVFIATSIDETALDKAYI